MVIQFYSTEVKSEVSKPRKNSIKRNHVVAKPTLEDYIGRANDNLKQNFLSEYLEHYSLIKFPVVVAVQMKGTSCSAKYQQTCEISSHFYNWINKLSDELHNCSH